MRWLGIPLILIYCGLHAGKLEVCTNCVHTSVESAVDDAAPFDTIIVLAGEYTAVNIEINKPITLLGKGAVLNGENEGYIFRILSDSVTIRGFRLIDAGKSYTKDYAAIYASQVYHFIIEENTIEGPFFGVLIEKSSYGKVSENLIFGQSQREDDSGNGIHLWHCSDVIIENNEVFGMRDGIYFEFVNNSEITGNFSHHNIRYGLHFMFSNNDDYVNNTFQSNGSGVAVMFSKFITMRENRFLNNWGTASYGLLLKEIYDAEVINNSFIENTVAVFTEGSTRVKYEHNNFERNGWAIKVSGGCYTNSFTENNFIGNSFDVSYNSKMNDNVFQNNFWDTYSGYDLDKNGKGDVPHRPVKLFSYIVNETPETVILLRSLFVDIINFSERVSPVFTPDELTDPSPSIKQFE